MKYFKSEHYELAGNFCLWLFLVIIVPAWIWSANDNTIVLWEACIVVFIGLIALLVLIFILVILSIFSNKLLQSTKQQKGYTPKMTEKTYNRIMNIAGILFYIGMILFAVWFAGGSYNPDCPASAQRYC